MAKKKSSASEAVKARARRAAPKRAVQKVVKQAAAKRAERKPALKPYDAERSFGMIPGLAERMAEYMRTMRDDR